MSIVVLPGPEVTVSLQSSLTSGIHSLSIPSPQMVPELCVCMCVHVRVRMSVCVHVCLGMYVCACMPACVCVIPVADHATD